MQSEGFPGMALTGRIPLALIRLPSATLLVNFVFARRLFLLRFVFPAFSLLFTFACGELDFIAAS